MNQPNQNQTTEEIIAFFGDYTAAKLELEQAIRFSSPRVEGPDMGRNPRLESAQQRFDSVLAKLPSREQAEAAALVEINTMAAEWRRLKDAFKSAVWQELQAVQARDNANQTVEYGQRFSILAIDAVKAAHAAHAAQEKLNAVIYARQVIEGQMDRTFKRGIDEYTDPRTPGSLAPAARDRVESLLGKHYQAGEFTELKTRLGLTDKMLAQLAGTT